MTGNECQKLSMRDRMPIKKISDKPNLLEFAKANLRHVTPKVLTLKEQTTERKVMCNDRA